MPHFKILKGGEDDLLKLPISMVADFFGENKNVSKWGIQFLHVKWLKLSDFSTGNPGFLVRILEKFHCHLQKPTMEVEDSK